MDAHPDRIGRYRILSRLGAGGMGEVWLGHDDSLDRRVAIKRLLPDTTPGPQAIARLLVEARAVAKLEHPHICGIYEVGQDDGGPFIVMPVVEGQTLAARLAAGPLPLNDAIELGSQIADALAYAHTHGILHRDVKTANVIVDSRGCARVMDFGLAKAVPGAALADSAAATVPPLTQEGTTLGTVHYMAPEQARGQTDARSDIFSVGVVLYEMIAGRRPFDGACLADVLVATQTTEPPPVARFRPDVPDELQRIVSKALRKSPNERYQNAHDLAIDLRALLRGSSDHPIAPATVPSGAPVPRSSRLMWALAAVALLAGAGGIFLWVHQAPRASAAAAGAAPDIDSLVVLPLVNDTGNADREYLADGITESLIRSLSQLPKLKVLSRNTAFHFKGKTDDTQQIAGTLNVAAVVTGRVRKADDQLVIDIELSDAHAAVILSQQYVEPAASAQSVESNIAQDVARHLRVKLSGDDERAVAKKGTANSEAYQSYLRGRFFLNQESAESAHQAVALLQQSVALDPHYALAYAGLAQAYLELGLFYEPPKETMPLAKKYANLSLAADPAVSDARIVLGLVALTYDWDWDAAAKATTVNGAMLPEAVSMFTCATHLLESTGHSNEADGEIQAALAIDPLSVPIRGEIGCSAYYQHRYDDAIRGYRDAIALDPGNVVAFWGLGKALNQKQEYQRTVSELQRFVSDSGGAPPIILSALGCAYASLGDAANMDRVLKMMSAMSAKVFVDPYLVAAIYATHHDKTRALDLLDEAFNVRSGMLTALPREPQWDGIRDEPRFKDLLKRVGL